MLAAAQENPPATWTSGTVVYEQIVKLDIKLEGESAQFANMMPKERKSEKILRFTPGASLFENKAADEEQNLRTESGGGAVMIKMVEPDNKVYTDLSAKVQIEKREFMTREFLIGSPSGSTNWKITGNQKLIMNYPCQEASMVNGKDTVRVWFTPLIPVPAGPGVYNGLPGLVLAVDINNGKQILNARSVDLTPVADNQIAKPGKGKKVTREEYDKMVEEKMKEMGGEAGPGGNRVMIRIHP